MYQNANKQEKNLSVRTICIKDVFEGQAEFLPQWQRPSTNTELETGHFSEQLSLFLWSHSDSSVSAGHGSDTLQQVNMFSFSPAEGTGTRGLTLTSWTLQWLRQIWGFISVASIVGHTGNTFGTGEAAGAEMHAAGAGSSTTLGGGQHIPGLHSW